MKCLSDETLVRVHYGDGGGDACAHVRECLNCARRYRVLQEDLELIGDDLSQTVAQPASMRAGGRGRHPVATAAAWKWAFAMAAAAVVAIALSIDGSGPAGSGLAGDDRVDAAPGVETEVVAVVDRAVDRGVDGLAEILLARSYAPGIALSEIGGGLDVLQAALAGGGFDGLSAAFDDPGLDYLQIALDGGLPCAWSSGGYFDDCEYEIAGYLAGG